MNLKIKMRPGKIPGHLMNLMFDCRRKGRKVTPESQRTPCKTNKNNEKNDLYHGKSRMP
jgi:hypothetical protein